MWSDMWCGDQIASFPGSCPAFPTLLQLSVTCSTVMWKRAWQIASYPGSCSAFRLVSSPDPTLLLLSVTCSTVMWKRAWQIASFPGSPRMRSTTSDGSLGRALRTRLHDKLSPMSTTFLQETFCTLFDVTRQKQNISSCQELTLLQAGINPRAPGFSRQCSITELQLLN